MNFKAWDNNEATYGLPYWLLLVLKVCGRLWVRTTSGRGSQGSLRLRGDTGKPALVVCGTQE